MVDRVVTASPWRFGGHPRRARSGLRRVAKSRCFREEPGADRTGGAAREQRVAGGLGSDGDLGAKQGREREKREIEKERDLPDSNLNFFKNFQLTLEKF